MTGERFDLHPRLTYYAKPAFLDLSLYAGYHERFYNASAGQNRDEVQQIGEADAGGTLSAPLERVYDGRLRHLLVPSIEYGYVQTRGDENLPFFDFNDQPLGQSIATWSLANVVTRKFDQSAGVPEYRDLLYLKLSQAYQFSGDRRDLLTLVDRKHHLDDLTLESRVTPLKDLSVALDGRYNPVDGNLSTGDLAVEVKGEGTNMAHLGYRFSRDALDYLEGRFTVPLNRHFSATLLGRYSFDRGALLESRYAIEYRQQCWSVIATFADRPSNLNGPGNTLNPGNREFTVNFTLFGLGALGPMRAF